MKRLPPSLVLLLLALPLVTYAVVQVSIVVRSEVLTPEPPTEQGPSAEALAAAHRRATAWSNEVRKAAIVAQQYRAPDASEASAEPPVRAVIQAAAARSANLNDLDVFLAEVERPQFSGVLKKQYEQWLNERQETKRDAEAVVAWLSQPPPIRSLNDAHKALAEVNTLIRTYTSRSKFSDTAKATLWRLRARWLVIERLLDLANSHYRTALQTPLPLEPGTNALNTAVETLRALKTQLEIFSADLRQAEADYPRLDPTLRANLEARGNIADECIAHEELLKLLGQDDLFTNATGADAWLAQVAARYRRTKDDALRAIIREKVQEFCEAYIPPQAQLDREVILNGRPVPRKNVVIKFIEQPSGKVQRQPLSADDEGLNEWTAPKRYSPESTFVEYMGSEHYLQELRATRLSQVAVMYNAARKQLTESTERPRWTQKSAERLKKACEIDKDLVDQLESRGSSSGRAAKIWTRLNILIAGMTNNPDLFAQ
ncbi:MAG: hypothetical protein RMJ56_12015 [Gemmataceae bacterium]|nr:hypothetical protein [Gemmata sp.]MDW8198317.1 hypothetical protein [Gemmataceae bacterium]